MKTARQLFDKMLKDYERVQYSPTDSESWFNFLVTADHLAEWHLNGDEKAAKMLREQHAILRVCHHLSRNGKHFKARVPKPKAGVVQIPPVARTTEASVTQFNGPLQTAHAAPATPTPLRSEFYLELSPDEATELGVTELSALELAGRLVDFWRERLDEAAVNAP